MLGDMSFEELGKLFPIILEKHNPVWAKLFQAEQRKVLAAVGNAAIAVYHIGSTSIPGIVAKPSIDMLMEITNDADLDFLKYSLQSIGYEFSAQPHKPAPHMMFMKGYTLNGFSGQTFHLHLRYKPKSGTHAEIVFRNYLRKNPSACKEYEALKKGLKEKFPNDRESYTNGKAEFIARIVTSSDQFIMYDV